MVENLVGYAKHDLTVPHEPFGDPTGANRAAAAWCAEVNGVEHSEICAIPAVRLTTERALLKALPSLQPEFGARPTTRKTSVSPVLAMLTMAWLEVLCHDDRHRSPPMCSGSRPTLDERLGQHFSSLVDVRRGPRP